MERIELIGVPDITNGNAEELADALVAANAEPRSYSYGEDEAARLYGDVGTARRRRLVEGRAPLTYRSTQCRTVAALLYLPNGHLIHLSSARRA
jgi:hypothetical protein